MPFTRRTKQNKSEVLTLVLKDGEEIEADRKKLSEASAFFSSLLNIDMKENREGIIRLEHITENVMEDVLDFIGSGVVNILTLENAEDLIEAADFLVIPSLKNVAGSFIDQNCELCAANCLSTYYYAEKYQIEGLVVKSMKFIFLNFLTVAESQEFLSLESKQVEQWICSSEIAVSKEDDVFKIILKWIEHNKSERQRKFQELFRHVRLTLISRDYLQGDVVTNELVKENSSCLKPVKDAINGLTSDDRPQSPRKWDTHLVVRTSNRETLCYQPDEDQWHQLANVPFFRNSEDYGHQQYYMTPCQQKLYAFHRIPVTLYSDFSVAGEIYDSSLNRWNELSFTCKRQMIKAAVTTLDGEIYSVSYPDNRDHVTDLNIWKYSVKSSSWQEMYCSSKFGGNLYAYGSCAVAMDKCVYIFGGSGCEYSPALRDYITARPMNTTTVARFNTTTNDLESLTEMKIGRSHACGFAVHERIFIAGGETGDQCLRTDTCEVYSIKTNEWQLIASLNAPRAEASMVCFKGTLYVVGGIHRGSYNCYNTSDSCSLALTVESYDFENNKWKQTTTIPTRRFLSPEIRKVVRACTLNISQGVLREPGWSDCLAGIY